eukprot:3386517-Pleurochrysis_carterae.AAC.1
MCACVRVCVCARVREHACACARGIATSSILRTSTSCRSSRCEPPMSSPMPGTSRSIAATVLPSAHATEDKRGRGGRHRWKPPST